MTAVSPATGACPKSPAAIRAVSVSIKHFAELLVHFQVMVVRVQYYFIHLGLWMFFKGEYSEIYKFFVSE